MNKIKVTISKPSKQTVLNVALCQGRHDIPQATDGCIFTEIIDVTDTKAMYDVISDFFDNNKVCNYYCYRGECYDCDEYYLCGGSQSTFYPIKLNLYVTGLTVALVEVIKFCNFNNIDLTLYHFNRDTNEYYAQEVL